eukprot:scaffold16579_cov130-Isochrysis_galbana.AAC.4
MSAAAHMKGETQPGCAVRSSTVEARDCPREGRGTHSAAKCQDSSEIQSSIVATAASHNSDCDSRRACEQDPTQPSETSALARTAQAL